MKARALIFWEDGFPFIDTAPIEPMYIAEAMPPVESVRSLGVAEVRKRLDRESVDLLINPYGSAFPVDAWPEILRYLEAGGNLLNLGGLPFSIPVSGEDFKQGERTHGYLRELGIAPGRFVEASEIRTYSTLIEEPLLSGLLDEFTCERACELLRPDEECAEGVILRPLVFGVDTSVAPVVALDRVFGRFSGGRWALANFASAEPVKRDILHRLAGFAALGPDDFQVRPSFACYHTDERATLVVHANLFERPDSAPPARSLFLTIRKDNIAVARTNVDIEDFSSPYYREVTVSIPLSPGQYTVEARLSTGDSDLTDKFGPHYLAGFWCYDAAEVSMTRPLAVDGWYLMRREKPSVQIGAAYRARGGDLLLDPNPALWERDFAEMEASGLNLVHVSAGTLRAMQAHSRPSEEFLRAASALMLTAARHNLTVVFDLFPPDMQGDLDRDSLLVHREYVSALSRRLAGFNNLIWRLPEHPDQRWVGEMVSVLRRNGSKSQLVSADGGDLTCAHSGDAFFSVLEAHAAGKPVLAIEPLSSGAGPEREVVAALGAGATGIAVRDRQGADVLSQIRAFAKEIRPWIVGRRQEDVVVPAESLSPAVSLGVIHRICGVPARVANEGGLGKPGLIILPGAGESSLGASLLKCVKDGSVLLVTGPAVGLDKLGLDVETSLAEEEERVIIFGSEFTLRFPPGARKATGSTQVRTVAHGKGKVIFFPLPVELSGNTEAVSALYRYALRQAEITERFCVSPADTEVLVRPQFFEKAVWYSVISESAEDRMLELTDMLTMRTVTVSLPAGGAAMFVLSQADGSLLARFGNVSLQSP